MTEKIAGPFGDWAQTYREIGLNPRPLKFPGVNSKGKPIGKSCLETSWQKFDSELPEELLNQWDEQYPTYNIGLLMGTPLPDGTRLGALDIDHDAYVNLGNALLSNPVCGRFGKKGAVFFVRYTAGLEVKKKIKVKGDHNEKYGDVAEFLFEGTLCVIPPSIHPETGEPYRWIGTPLHEVNFNNLPLIGE